MEENVSVAHQIPKKNLLIVVSTLVALIVLGLIGYWQSLSRGREATKDLETSLKQLTPPPSIADIPSANPLEEALPAINPLEKTNPFKNAYQNPFE